LSFLRNGCGEHPRFNFAPGARNRADYESQSTG
jgi:hypothetical protein